MPKTNRKIGRPAIWTEPRTRINIRLPTAKLVATRLKIKQQKEAGEKLNGRTPTLTGVLELGMNVYLSDENNGIESI